MAVSGTVVGDGNDLIDSSRAIRSRETVKGTNTLREGSRLGGAESVDWLLGIYYQGGCEYWIRQWCEMKLSLLHSGGSVKLQPKPNFFPHTQPYPEGEAYQYWLRKLEKHPQVQAGRETSLF